MVETDRLDTGAAASRTPTQNEAAIADSLSAAASRDLANGNCIRQSAECLCMSPFSEALQGLGLLDPKHNYGAWFRSPLGNRVASVIEARSDATPKSGAAEGESVAPKEDAQ